MTPARRLQGLNWLKLIQCVNRKDPAMFEVYKRIGWHHVLAPYSKTNQTIEKNIDQMYEPDEELFQKIKTIISKLVVVKPADRMKLKEARDQLMALDNVLKEFNDFLLLKKRF